jgi:hypothetical protein
VAFLISEYFDFIVPNNVQAFSKEQAAGPSQIAKPNDACTEEA